jgi:ubiquitin C-terminal hydrolase
VEAGLKKESKQKVVYVESSNKNLSKKINGVNINLKLTEDLKFSMTTFDKVNKGLVNSSINCYMNVSLQSLIACPAFFNMLTTVSESLKTHGSLFQRMEVLMKLVEFSRYFEPNVLASDETKIYH